MIKSRTAILIENRSILSLPCCVVLLVCVCGRRMQDAVAAERRGTSVKPGASVNLFKAWPQLAKARRSDLATIEFFVRPDANAIARPNAFVLVLSNRGGRDTAGISLTMKQGAIRANVLGTFMQSTQKLKPKQWVHVVLTIDPNTINKQARLWINGMLVADELVLEAWPKSFEVAKLLSDHWGQGRVFSGQLGDVRISSIVRYSAPFKPPSQLLEDDDTVVHIGDGQVPLRDDR